VPLAGAAAVKTSRAPPSSNASPQQQGRVDACLLAGQNTANPLGHQHIKTPPLCSHCRPGVAMWEGVVTLWQPWPPQLPTHLSVAKADMGM
jgi:hypothetical protein